MHTTPEPQGNLPPNGKPAQQPPHGRTGGLTAPGQAKLRRHFGDDQKATIVRRHLNDKVPVSDLADEYHIQPSQIYLWVKQVLDQAERAFQRQTKGQPRRPAADPKDRRIAQLETQVNQLTTKLTQKNEVISELMEDNLKSKKELGEL